MRSLTLRSIERGSAFVVVGAVLTATVVRIHHDRARPVAHHSVQAVQPASSIPARCQDAAGADGDVACNSAWRQSRARFFGADDGARRASPAASAEAR